MNIYGWITLAAVAAVFLVFAPEKWKNGALVVLTAGLAYLLASNNDTSEQKKENEQLDEKIENENNKQEQIKKEIDKLEEEGLDEEDKPENTGDLLDSVIDGDRNPPGGSS